MQTDTPPKDQTRPLMMVLICTVIGAISQIIMKRGTGALGPHPTMLDTALGMFTNPMLFTGYALYGVSAVLLVLALRKGELSLLQPVFTLTYVWVMILSVLIFHDSINALKLAGIAVIVGGVAVLGRASRS